jgi:Arc/MetJ family transcription regulator
VPPLQIPLDPQTRLVVYDWCISTVRTNIEIEDTYVQAIIDRYGVRTKTAAVDLALRHLAGQPMTRDEALAMQGAHAIAELPADAPPRSGA